MTIDKAIENNEEHAKAHRYDTYPDYFNGLNLGIEALKRVARLRDYYGGSANELLPGETEE